MEQLGKELCKYRYNIKKGEKGFDEITVNGQVAANIFARN